MGYAKLFLGNRQCSGSLAREYLTLLSAATVKPGQMVGGV